MDGGDESLHGGQVQPTTHPQQVAANAGVSTALAGFHRDAFEEVHGGVGLVREGSSRLSGLA